jgi:sulfite exporter TauE/SafE
MCGGIVGVLTMGLPGALQRSGRHRVPYVLAYNAGRLLAYSLAGTLLGGIGFLAAHLAMIQHVQLILRLAAGLFTIALGLYVGGWWQGLARVEQAGGMVWRRIQPLGKRLLPVRTTRQALLLGFVWGWLPCGLVYSVLIWAIAAGSADQGALLMLSFGLGTLPTLLAMGVFYTWLAAALRTTWVRHGAAGIIVLLGIDTVASTVRGL